jgi:hypothetical protein
MSGLLDFLSSLLGSDGATGSVSDVFSNVDPSLLSSASDAYSGGTGGGGLDFLSALGDQFSGSGQPSDAGSASAQQPWSDARWGGSSYSGSSPAEAPSAGKSLLDGATGWLGKVANGDKTALGQMKLGLGGLGLVSSLFQSKNSRNQLTPAQLQAMLQTPYSQWTPQQAALVRDYFNKPLPSFSYKPPTVTPPTPALPNPNIQPAAPVKLARGGGIHAHGCGCRMCNGGAVFMANGGVPGASPGQSDNVHARLSPGEYVIDADVVSALGDGNNTAGAQRLDEMRAAVRQHKRGAPASKIPPKALSPLAYMKENGRA